MSTKHTFIRHILSISEFLANKWYGAWMNEIAWRGRVQGAGFDYALPVPPYIHSLVALRYRNGGFVRRELQHFSKATRWYGPLVLECPREVHRASDVVDTHFGR